MMSMPTVTEARQALADALSALPGVTMMLREPRTARALDGWTTAGTVTPETFRTSMAALQAVVLLSADYLTADEAYDTLATAAVDAASTGGLGTSDVRVESGIVPVGDQSSPMYALIVNVTMEVV